MLGINLTERHGEDHESMTELEDQFRELDEKLAGLQRDRAVLAAKEEEKATRRSVLVEELTKAGVNVDDLPGEQQRLEAEAVAEYAEAEKEVGEFERKLGQVRELQQGLNVIEPEIDDGLDLEG